MGSKVVASVALLLSINLLFISMVSSSSHHYPPPPPSHVPTPVTPPPPSSTPPSPSSTPPPPTCEDLSLCLRLIILEDRKDECCTLIPSVVDLDARVCLCGQLRALLGNTSTIITLDLLLNLLLNRCEKSGPPATCSGT